MAGGPILFNLVYKTHISIYRWTGGWLGARLGSYDILLLTTTGRKSHQKRTIPLAYFMDGENYVITASYGGGPQHPGWYFNLKADPRVQIQVGRQHFNVTAVQADPEQKKRLWARLVSLTPRYDGYQKRTSREIPMMILHPNNGKS
jgi:deazaflavin-dependent oxidoreductase (nitroreductase family)